MNLTQIIRDTKSLRKLISKSAKTISKKGVKEEAEKWVVHYHRDLFESLSSFPEAIKALQYLVKSINNSTGVRIILASENGDWSQLPLTNFSLPKYFLTSLQASSQI